jgi:prepilin-type N-terminal cleavage/methylation domain-containing protein
MKDADLTDRRRGVILRTAGEEAFTLVEVMVSLVILVAVFSGFYLCLSEGFATAKASRESLRASDLLQQQMEIIRLYTWSQINSNGFIPATFTATLDPKDTSSNAQVYTGQIIITNAPMSESYSNDHRLVTVTLTWGSGGVQRKRQMSTLVSQYGLHNYYY